MRAGTAGPNVAPVQLAKRRTRYILFFNSQEFEKWLVSFSANPPGDRRATANDVAMQTLSATVSTRANVNVATNWLPTRRALVVSAIFIACYVALAWGARIYMVRPFGITPWNPVAGLALALLLIGGYRFWPALAVATCLANLMIRGVPAAPFTQLLLPLTITLAYTGMAALLRGPIGFRLEFDRLRDVFALLGVAAFGTLLVAFTFVSIIRFGSPLPWPDFNHTVMRSWI